MVGDNLICGCRETFTDCGQNARKTTRLGLPPTTGELVNVVYRAVNLIRFGVGD